MALGRPIRTLALLAVLVWPVGWVLAQTSEPLSGPAQELYPGSLTGQLLVASPEIGDPRFANTVIMMIRHDREGAFGIVINRPIEEHSIAEILGWIGESSDGVEGKVEIYAGGPVQPSVGFILHSPEYKVFPARSVAVAVIV